MDVDVEQKRKALKRKLTKKFLSTLVEACRCSETFDSCVVSNFVEEMHELADIKPPLPFDLLPYNY